MAIKPKCDMCNKELLSYGALLFSPPPQNADGSCGTEIDKFHICATCFNEYVLDMLQSKSAMFKDASRGKIVRNIHEQNQI
jgi:hypothetical protein